MPKLTISYLPLQGNEGLIPRICEVGISAMIVLQNNIIWGRRGAVTDECE